MKKYIFYISLVVMMFTAALSPILPPILPKTKIVMQVKKGRKRKEDKTLKKL